MGWHTMEYLEYQEFLEATSVGLVSEKCGASLDRTPPFGVEAGIGRNRLGPLLTEISSRRM